MTHDSYKSWIDAMPIDDVRQRIERLERKLSDLHVLERLYADRHGEGGGGEASARSWGEPAELGAPEGAEGAGGEEQQHGDG